MTEDTTPKEDLLKALKEAQPDWRGSGGLRGNVLDRYIEKQNVDFQPATIVHHFSEEPQRQEDATQQNVSEGTGTALKVSFLCTDASTVVDGDTVNRVHVSDGEVNGELPSGMGGDDFVLTLDDPTDVFVYVIIAFNPTTHAITSRDVGVSNVADLPESRAESETTGFLVCVLAEAFLDDDGNFQVVNRRLGDIDFELVYGSDNAGKRALLPVKSEFGGWIDLDFM